MHLTHFDDDRFDIMQRPFGSLDEQINTIVNNWNKIVKPEDIVYHLGDVFKFKFNPDIVKKLNGKKHLIIGNHDKEVQNYAELFTGISDSLTIKVKKDGTMLYLNHYPSKGLADKFNICGHVHSAWKVQLNTINVGVDAWNFRPVSLEQVLFTINGIMNFYDKDIFAAYEKANATFAGKRGKQSSYADKEQK